MNAIPALFLITLIFCVDGISVACETQIAITPKEIQKRLNQRYQTSFGKKYRKALKKEDRLHMRRPYQVLELDRFFETGKMPKLTDMKTIYFVRMSRKQGILYLRSALAFPEERSWIYVKELEIWIYDSVGAASATNVMRNALLNHLLTLEFGETESFHTHPHAAFTQIMQESGASYLSQGYSTQAFRRAVLTLPSHQDLTTLIYQFREDKRTPTLKSIAAIIHPWGVTTYSIRSYIETHPKGEQNYIFPNLLNNLSYAKTLVAFHQVSIAIKNAIRKMNEDSARFAEDIMDNPPWTKETRPQFFFGYQSYNDL